MTRQEAHFWFVAMTESTRRDVSPAMLVDELRTQSDRFRGDITREEVVARIRSIASDPKQWHADTGQLLVLSMNLFSPEDWIALSRETYLAAPVLARPIQPDPRSTPFAEISCRTLRKPSARQGGMRSGRTSLARHCRRTPNTGFPMADYLAAALGMHEEVYRILQLMPDDQYSQPNYFDADHRPQLLVLGLGSPWLVEKEMRRLKLILKTPDDVRGWIAHTEDSALDLVRDSILASTKKDECEAILRCPGQGQVTQNRRADARADAGVEGLRGCAPLARRAGRPCHRRPHPRGDGAGQAGRRGPGIPPHPAAKRP